MVGDFYQMNLVEYDSSKKNGKRNGKRYIWRPSEIFGEEAEICKTNNYEKLFISVLILFVHIFKGVDEKFRKSSCLTWK